MVSKARMMIRAVSSRRYKRYDISFSLAVCDIYWNKAVILCSYGQNVDCSVISEVKYFSVSVSVSVKPLTFYSMHPYFS